MITVENGLAEALYLTQCDIYGRTLYDLNPVSYIARDTDSINDYGFSALDLDMVYQDNTQVGQETADDLLEKR